MPSSHLMGKPHPASYLSAVWPDLTREMDVWMPGSLPVSLLGGFQVLSSSCWNQSLVTNSERRGAGNSSKRWRINCLTDVFYFLTMEREREWGREGGGEKLYQNGNFLLTKNNSNFPMLFLLFFFRVWLFILFRSLNFSLKNNILMDIWTDSAGGEIQRMLGDNCGKVTVTTVGRCLVRTEIVKLFIKLIRSGQAWKYEILQSWKSQWLQSDFLEL